MKRAASVAGLPAEAEVRPVVVKRARAGGEPKVRKWHRGIYARRAYRNPWRILPDGSVEMKLTQGATTVFDKKNHSVIRKNIWYLNNGGYAQSSGRASALPGVRQPLLHRLLLLPQDVEEVDHIDRNRLNNKESNLRKTTRSGNARNMSLMSTNTNGLNGITEYGDFSFKYYINDDRRVSHSTYNASSGPARSKAKNKAKSKRLGKYNKNGSVPSISHHEWFDVSICRGSVDGARKRIAFKASDLVDRRRALDEAVSFRDATQAKCRSNNGKAPRTT